jgi:hypothetical protein
MKAGYTMSNSEVLLDADIRDPLFNYLEIYYGKVRFLEVDKDSAQARREEMWKYRDEEYMITVLKKADPGMRVYYSEMYVQQ